MLTEQVRPRRRPVADLSGGEEVDVAADEVGADPGFRPCGCLFLAERRETLDAFAAAREVQWRARIEDARPVGFDEIARINPAVRLDGIVGGVFCPSDGFLRPLEILRGYVEAAERLGVRFAYGEPCTGLRVEGGRVTAVETPSGRSRPAPW